MFGLSIEERAAKKGTYWRVIHETTGEPWEGEKLFKLAEKCAHEDYLNMGAVDYKPRYMAHFMLSYTHSHVVSDMPVMPKDEAVSWAEQVRDMG